MVGCEKLPFYSLGLCRGQFSLNPNLFKFICILTTQYSDHVTLGDRDFIFKVTLINKHVCMKICLVFNIITVPMREETSVLCTKHTF